MRMTKSHKIKSVVLDGEGLYIRSTNFDIVRKSIYNVKIKR